MTNIVGKMPVFVNTIHINIITSALLGKSQDMPVIIGSNLQFNGAGKLPLTGFEKMLYL